MLIVSETWLSASVPDKAMELTNFSLHHADRTKDSSKSRGGGLGIYINNDWCTNHIGIENFCSPELEYLLLKCRPFYLPREFSVIIIPPQANAKLSLALLHLAVSKQQDSYPDGVFIVAGDFNCINLKTVFQKFYQHVHCPARGSSILDQEFFPTHHWGNLITFHCS